MHEASLIEHLLEEVHAIARQNLAAAAFRDDEVNSQVARIQVEVGTMAGVELDLLSLAYERLATDAGFAHANLELISVPLAVVCRDCRRETEPDRPIFRCVTCGSMAVDVVRGEICVLAQVELETERLGT